MHDTSEDARDLVSKLIVYQSSDRLSAAAVSGILPLYERYADVLRGSEASIL